MKKIIQKASFTLTIMLICAMVALVGNVYADDDTSTASESPASIATSISISPVSKILQLESSQVYEDSFSVSNNGNGEMLFEVYASPYSYTMSEEDGEYRLGFSNENNYTQISRWVTFKDENGNYVKNPQFKAGPNEVVTVYYRITTPESIPAGGQYAVLFAHTISGNTNSSGIKTEASPGMVVYGRSNGETIIGSDISGLEINQTLTNNEGTKNIINASAKVKNTGNVDFMAVGTLEVTGLFGQVYYSTPSTRGRVSVIPETELPVSDTWEETPYFGIFNAKWTVEAGEDKTEITKLIILLPLPILVAFILVLTFLIIWIIIMVRKRKESRSRYSM